MKFPDADRLPTTNVRHMCTSPFQKRFILPLTSPGKKYFFAHWFVAQHLMHENNSLATPLYLQ